MSILADTSETTTVAPAVEAGQSTTATTTEASKQVGETTTMADPVATPVADVKADTNADGPVNEMTTAAAATADDDATTVAKTKTAEQPVADTAIAFTDPSNDINTSRKEVVKEEPAKEGSVKEDEPKKYTSAAAPAAEDKMDTSDALAHVSGDPATNDKCTADEAIVVDENKDETLQEDTDTSVPAPGAGAVVPDEKEDTPVDFQVAGEKRSAEEADVADEKKDGSPVKKVAACKPKADDHSSTAEAILCVVKETKDNLVANVAHAVSAESVAKEKIKKTVEAKVAQEQSAGAETTDVITDEEKEDTVAVEEICYNGADAAISAEPVVKKKVEKKVEMNADECTPKAEEQSTNEDAIPFGGGKKEDPVAAEKCTSSDPASVKPTVEATFEKTVETITKDTTNAAVDPIASQQEVPGTALSLLKKDKP